MRIDVDISKSFEEALRRELGNGLELTIKEALALKAFSRGLLSLGQFAEMLDLTTNEADGLLKEHGILLDISLPAIQDDVASLRESLRT